MKTKSSSTKVLKAAAKVEATKEKIQKQKKAKKAAKKTPAPAPAPAPAHAQERENEQIVALLNTLEKLYEIAADENRTRYMRLKTSCYIEALEAIKEMIDTNNVKVLKRLILPK